MGLHRLVQETQRKKIVQLFLKFDKFYNVFAISTCKDIEVGQKIVGHLSIENFKLQKTPVTIWSSTFHHSITWRNTICCRTKMFDTKKIKKTQYSIWK